MTVHGAPREEEGAVLSLLKGVLRFVLLTLAIQLLVLAFNAAMALCRHAPTTARVTVAA